MKKSIIYLLSVLFIVCIPFSTSACDKEKSPQFYSENLDYILSEDESYYSIVSLGLCIDRDVIIPSTHRGLPIKEIYANAFYEEEHLNTVTIADSITVIGASAFYNCTNLKKVTIGNSVTHVGDCAFQNCTKLTSITIPQNTIFIGKQVFKGCTSLTNVTFQNFNNWKSSRDIPVDFSDATRNAKNLTTSNNVSYSCKN